MAQSLARLYAMGVDLDWSWQADALLRPEAMPLYPFEREHLLPDFVHRPVCETPGHEGVTMADFPVITRNRGANGGEDASVQLTRLQRETFRQVCGMQQGFLDAGADLKEKS